MLHGLLHGDAACRIELEEFHAEVEAGLVEVFEVGFGVDALELGECGFEVGEVAWVRRKVRTFIH